MSPASALITFGLLLVGWIVDFFLMPSLEREAELRFRMGEIDYNIAWVFLTFLGVLGVHRMYMGKWITGVIYLCTGGFFLLGVLWDFLTLNEQLSDVNNQY